MIDPYIQQNQTSMYMNPWQGYTASPGMMSGGPQGYMAQSNMSNMQNQFGGNTSGLNSSPYGAMYDNPFVSQMLMNKSNVLAKPRGSQFATQAAHMDAISMGTTGAMVSTAMEISGGLAGGAVGAMIGQAMIPIPVIGALVGGMAGSMIGDSGGEMAGSIYANRVGRQMETHKSLMGLSNTNSPYGGGFGYSSTDAKDIYKGMEQMSGDDPYFGMGDIGRILDEGIKSGSISGGSSTGDIKSKLKGLKETAKSLVEIFGDSDISEIMDTMRRLNGTGMSNNQAIETSRTVGMAARAHGMKEGDLFNKLNQQGEIEGSSGLTAIGSMSLNSGLMLSMKQDKDFDKKFANTDHAMKAADSVKSDYAKLMHGDSGQQLLAEYNMTTTAGLAIMGEAIAAEKVGGREVLNSMDIKDRDKLIGEGFGEAFREKNKLARMTELQQDGNLDMSSFTTLISGNTQGQASLAEGLMGGAKENKNFEGYNASNFAQVIDIASKDKVIGLKDNISISAAEKNINEYVQNIDSEKFKTIKDRTARQERVSADRESGSMEKQFQAMLSKANTAFGDFVDGLVQSIKGAASNSVLDKPISAETAGLASDLGRSAKATSLVMNSMPKYGTEDMLTTGDDGASIWNYASLTASASKKEIQSLSARAKLDTQWFSAGTIGGIASTPYIGEFFAKAAFSGGRGVIDDEEGLAMAKSGLSQSSTTTMNNGAVQDSFKQYKAGDISLSELQQSMADIDGDISGSLELFTAETSKTDMKNAPLALAHREDFEPLKDSGLLSVYGASKMEYREKDEYSAVANFFNLQDHSLTPKSKEDLADMKVLATERKKAMTSIGSALEGLEKVDFKELKQSMSDNGDEVGADIYLATSGISEGMDARSQKFLKRALSQSDGKRDTAQNRLGRDLTQARAFTSAGSNTKSFGLMFGMDIQGTADAEEIGNYAFLASVAGTQKKRKGENFDSKNANADISTILQEGMFMDPATARQVTNSAGGLANSNKKETAIAQIADPRSIGLMHSKRDENQSEFSKSIMKSGEATSEGINLYHMDINAQKRVHGMAQVIAKQRTKGRGATIANAITSKSQKDLFEGASDEERRLATVYSKQAGIEDRKFKGFQKDVYEDGVIRQGAMNLTKIFGKEFTSTKEQAEAFAVSGMFNVDKETGIHTGATSSEIKDMYKQARERQANGETMSPTGKALVNAMDTLSENDLINEKIITGDQLFDRVMHDTGMGGFSKKSIEDSSRGGVSAIESLLSQINVGIQKMAGRDEKASTGKENLVSHNTTIKNSGLTITDLDGTELAKPPKGSQPAGGNAFPLTTPVTKDMVDGDTITPNVMGKKKDVFLATNSTELKDITVETADVMVTAAREFNKDGKAMVVTSGTASTVDPQHKEGSPNEKGTAFNIDLKQFKDKDEAKKFLAGMANTVSEETGQHIKVLAKEDHAQIAVVENKKQAGYSETEDAYSSVAWDTKRKPGSLKAVSMRTNRAPNKKSSFKMMKREADINGNIVIHDGKEHAAKRKLADKVNKVERLEKQLGKAQRPRVLKDDATLDEEKKFGQQENIRKSRVDKLEGKLEKAKDALINDPMAINSTKSKEVGAEIKRQLSTNSLAVGQDNELKGKSSKIPQGFALTVTDEKSGEKRVISTLNKPGSSEKVNYHALGGSKASQLNMPSSNQTKAEGHGKKDVVAINNSLLERIASGIESMRDTMSTAGPIIKKV